MNNGKKCRLTNIKQTETGRLVNIQDYGNYVSTLIFYDLLLLKRTVPVQFTPIVHVSGIRSMG